MRSIEVLIHQYPDKTGKELLIIQEQDKIDDEKAFKKRHQRVLDFIEDININGGYYRGKFGLDQYYYYRVYNLRMDNVGEVFMDVEKITMFIGRKHGVIAEGGINFEKRTKEYETLSSYAFDSPELNERVTIKEWNAINQYIEAMPTKFW